MILSLLFNILGKIEPTGFITALSQNIDWW